MITDLLSATLFDALHTIKNDEAFTAEPIKRKEAVQKALGKDYPKSLQSYLSSVSKTQFGEDMQALIPLLGGKNSLLVEKVGAKQNHAFNAFLAFAEKELPDLLEHGMKGEKTALQNAVAEILSDKREKRILIREAQELLHKALKKDSPTVQIATDLEDKDFEEFTKLLRAESPNGIPAITVNRALLGGMRMFQDGQLIDRSWHAKLTTLFSRLR